MIQMIGRGLRKVDPERYPGVHKDDCIVLDFGTSVLMHGGIEQAVNLDQKGVKQCPECTATVPAQRSEEHTSELQSLMRISYAVFCLKNKKQKPRQPIHRPNTHRQTN